jgi:hypothetical protein
MAPGISARTPEGHHKYDARTRTSQYAHQREVRWRSAFVKRVYFRFCKRQYIDFIVSRSSAQTKEISSCMPY